ncbi:hypothetical protein PUR23_20915 [Methylorubrum populi]|uniref:hypothetical protein n=1 Tax=Methylorubrum populi TaxID=223967 RepID=UPI0031FA2FD5
MRGDGRGEIEGEELRDQNALLGDGPRADGTAPRQRRDAGAQEGIGRDRTGTRVEAAFRFPLGQFGGSLSVGRVDLA